QPAPTVRTGTRRRYRTRCSAMTAGAEAVVTRALGYNRRGRSTSSVDRGGSTAMAKRYPKDVNGRVLRGMRSSGYDMTAEYDIDFEYLFPDQRAAEEFMRRVAGDGRRIEQSEYAGRSGYHWEVCVVMRMVLTYADICRVEQELADVADACGGCENGWGI